MSHSTITQAGNLIRANTFTEHGASSKTCLTVSEARAWITLALNRKPFRGGKNAEQKVITLFPRDRRPRDT